MAEEGTHGYEDLWRGLNRKGATAQCPSCGGTEWGRTEDDRLVFVQLLQPNGHLAPEHNEGFAAFVLICDRCGFLRFHSTNHLLED